jgi:predicted metal-dependent phosphoesterase TrpH
MARARWRGGTKVAGTRECLCYDARHLRPIAFALIDLHLHSDRSDGALSPERLIQRAAERGVRALALTDHDTTDGNAAAAAAARAQAIVFIPGVEISVSWCGRSLHVVGLDIDVDSASLQCGLSELRAGRLQRARRIGEQLTKLGIAQAYEAAVALAASPDRVGRAHFARHMVATGVVGDMASAFRRFLGEGKPAFVRHAWAELSQAIGWIRAAGGIAVLAHPARYGLKPARLRTLMAEFHAAGGAAVEVVCGSHSKEQAEMVARLAAECGLLASAGSDFHSADHSWLDVGQLAPLPAICTPVWQHPGLRRLSALH